MSDSHKHSKGQQEALEGIQANLRAINTQVPCSKEFAASFINLMELL